MTDAYATSTAWSDLAATMVHNAAILSMTDATNNAFLRNSIDLSGFFGPQATAYKFPVRPVTSLQAVTEATAIDRKQYSTTSRTLTLNLKYGDITSVIDFVRSAGRDQDWAELGDLYGKSVAKTMDTAIGALYTASPSDVTNATTTMISEADVLAAKDILDAANAPAEGRVLVVNSDNYNNAFLGIANFVSNALRGSGDALVSGVLGSIHGFEVHMDNNVTETAGLARNVAFVRGTNWANSSFGYAYGTMPALMSGTPYKGDRIRFSWTRNNVMLAEEMAVEFLGGVVALRPEWIVEVQSRD